MPVFPQFRRDARLQPRGLALLAVLLLHAGIAASLLLPRFETPRGAVAEPPTMVLTNIAPTVVREEQPLPSQEQDIPVPTVAAPAVVQADVLPTSDHAEKRAGVAVMQTVQSAAPVAMPAPAQMPQAPAPQAAAPAPAATHVAAEVYQKILWQHVASRRPQGIHLEGEALVAFTLDRAGRLLSASIEQTSGNKMLDRLALRTVRTAAPFPPPPVSLPDDALRFSLAFNFK